MWNQSHINRFIKKGMTEVSIDFTDGTSFSATACQHTELEAELYIGGTGEPQIIKRYGDF